MDLKELAAEADRLITDGEDGYWSHGDGEEIAPGWKNLYCNSTGQSKVVILNTAARYVFKRDHVKPRGSTIPGRVFGTTEIDGHTYTVRLVRFESFDNGISAQEYVEGEDHYCEGWGGGHCKHTEPISRLTGSWDCHSGNWKIVGDEIVLFDIDTFDDDDF